jgi:hypothetical protein
MNRLIQQLEIKTSNLIALYEDNKAALLFADHFEDHQRSKHIDTRRNFVRKAVTNGDITLVHVNTKDRLADGMKRASQPALHWKCLKNYLSHYMFP